MADRTYRIRTSTSGPTRRTVYRLTVPPAIAKQIPEETEFTVELTEDGLLYRPAEKPPEPKPPGWITQQQRTRRGGR